MKNAVKHLLIYTQLVVFLFSISGFTIYRHECLKSGVVHVSFAEIADCCEKKTEEKAEKKPKCCKKKEEHSEKKKCCSYTKFSKQLKANYTFSVQKNIPVDFTSVTFFHKNVLYSHNISGEINHYNDTSPPLSGRGLLIKKQSFLI